MSRSGVSWMQDWASAWGLTPENWSPFVGCSPVGDECRNCWARRLEDGRLRHLDRCQGQRFWDGPVFQAREGEYIGDREIYRPHHWKKPRASWCCPSSDPFHRLIPDDMVALMLAVMATADDHHHLFLTKRSTRMRRLMTEYELGFTSKQRSNITAGVSVTSQETAHRIDDLLRTPAVSRMVSVEPMLGPVELGLCQEAPDWVIVGCESGADRRPCQLDWVKTVVAECLVEGVPVYVKQLDIDGRCSTDPDEWPEWARVQQIPRRKEAP